MAMRIAPVPYFWAQVKFPMLTDCDSNGVEQFADVTFRVKYKRLSDKDYQQLMKRIYEKQRLTTQQLLSQISPSTAEVIEKPAAEASEAPIEAIDDRGVVDMVVLDWDDMVGEDNEKLPFNKDNLERAMEVLGCRAAMVKRFLDLHKKEAEKNFAQPSESSTAG